MQLRGIATPGRWDTGVSTFGRYSYGLGGLNRGSTDDGVLGRSISEAYTIQRHGAVGDAPSALAPFGAPGSRVLYNPGPGVTFGGGATDADGRRYAPGTIDPGDVIMAQAFGAGDVDLTKGTEPIRSLASEDASRYSMYLRAGEADMRGGQYLRALDRFRLANQIDRQAPESLLSMAHANMSLGYYVTAGFYLHRAVAVFPELPLANLAVRDLFGGSVEFLKVRDELRRRAADRADDASVWLLLAYLEWFDHDDRAAAEALRQTVRVSIDPQITEAVEAFWDAGVAAGRLRGRLLPPTDQPPVESSPSS